MNITVYTHVDFICKPEMRTLDLIATSDGITKKICTLKFTDKMTYDMVLTVLPARSNSLVLEKLQKYNGDYCPCELSFCDLIAQCRYYTQTSYYHVRGVKSK